MMNIKQVILSFMLGLIGQCRAQEFPGASLEQKIGQKILLGFHGTSVDDPDVKEVIQCAQKGLIGGVILFSYNIVSQDQLCTLITVLKKESRYPLLVTVDQEGGRVQRLSSSNGFTDYLSAYEVAHTLTVEKAYNHYLTMAAELKQVGVTCTCGPVVDLHCDRITQRTNPVIGRLKRSFSADVSAVKKYAWAYIRAHEEQGIIPTLKHYPGHGLAFADSHKGIVDITHSHDNRERAPYKEVLKDGFDGMVMVGHLIHRSVDKKYPMSLSKDCITKWLRNEDGFKGVIITDDLHMGAIQREFGFEETVIQAVQAGVDILMFSNNPAANGGKPQAVCGVKTIIESIITTIHDALACWSISEQQINESYNRIMGLKSLEKR